MLELFFYCLYWIIYLIVFVVYFIVSVLMLGIFVYFAFMPGQEMVSSDELERRKLRYEVENYSPPRKRRKLFSRKKNA